MRVSATIALMVVALRAGGASGLVSRADTDHYYRVVSFPKVALKADPLERIETVKVVMHCGRFAAINHIRNDWSAKVVSPVSEETTLRMDAGHGSSSLCHSSDLDGFITVLVCDPACFDITASLSVFSYDTRLHERKVTFKQSDLLLVPLPNKHLQAAPR
jgi:hypothetical protein